MKISDFAHVRSDNGAMLAGFTVEALAYSDMCDLHISYMPDADLDGRFLAFCHDEQEVIYVNGWLFSIDPIAIG